MSGNQKRKRPSEDADNGSQAKRVRNDNDRANNNDHIKDNDELIKILIEEDECEYFVLKDIICAKSEFVRSLVSTTDWKSSKEKVVRFPDMHRGSLKMYLHWLHTGEIEPELYHGDKDAPEHYELGCYMNAYIIADESFDDRELRTHTMEFLIDNVPGWEQWYAGGRWLTSTWELTSEGSRLRTFMVEWTLHEWAGFTNCLAFDANAVCYPREFREEFDALLLKKGLRPANTYPDDEDDEKFQEEMRARLLDPED